MQLFRKICLLLVIVLCLPTVALAAKNDRWHNPYQDVTEDLWSFQYIKELNIKRILPSEQNFLPQKEEDRGRFVSCIYAMHLAKGGKREHFKEAVFEDVPVGHPYFDAICWAEKNGIVNGIGEGVFDPDGTLTRENICTILMRYASFASISLAAKNDVGQFVDSLRISKYARSPVIACQMADIVNGYKDGYFRPTNSISRQESAAMLWRFWDNIQNPPKSGVVKVDITPGCYDYFYENFAPVPDPTVPASETVDLSYFDKVAFVGDSVSVMLQYYCAASKALGNATFLCAGSLSATNALFGVGSESVHPFYQGKKVLVEDGVAQSGVKIVYIMLGINNIAYGIDKSTSDMVLLIDRILQKSPDVEIVIQSVTPMASSSTIITNSLNNGKITEYNNRMKAICEDRGWYYLNVAEVFTDENGYLIAQYCGDNGGMGIHFTSDAAAKWVEYLTTHVSEDMLAK